MILKYISNGNLDTLKGKKIALLHLDHPYGKEPLPLLESLGAKHGFSVLPIPVGLKEMQSQSAQWLQIRREKPDFVLMWGWGAMNGGAIVEAIKTKYPMNQFIGIWWAGHEGDLATAGPGAKGFRQISWNQSVPDAKVIADIKKLVLDTKLSDTPADQTSWVFYQRGVMISMMLVEAIKTAQAEFKTKVVDAEQVRWALENLKIDEAKLAELGMENMIVPFETTCADHTGHAGAWMLEWDGTKFVRISDLIKPDRDAIAPLEEAKGKEYADANQPWPLNDECKL
jgi:branched-chain amino acid transport system substrate-binding protein